MSLPTFIRKNVHQLVVEWTRYAQEQIPAAAALSIHDLEDSTRKLYGAIADDMETLQTSLEKQDKSWGRRPVNAYAIVQFATEHASHRVAQGFSVKDIVSEFRAARASVLRIWREQSVSDINPYEIERFNEALDEAINASVSHFEDQLERSRDLFLGMLGHDMRNPLGAIMMLADILSKDATLSPTSAKAALRINSSGVRLTHMLDDLLDFTRTRLGRNLPVDAASGNMGDSLARVIQELRDRHPATTILYSSAGDLYGRWDFARLAQLVSNLGGNAVQHGDRTRPITIHLDGTTERVVLTVHNHGVPIAPAVLKRIFDPLTRGSEVDTSARGSIGLGLYICRQIALAHRGTIDAVSDASGTTFTVDLPR